MNTIANKRLVTDVIYDYELFVLNAASVFLAEAMHARVHILLVVTGACRLYVCVRPCWDLFGPTCGCRTLTRLSVSDSRYLRWMTRVRRRTEPYFDTLPNLCIVWTANAVIRPNTGVVVEYSQLKKGEDAEIWLRSFGNKIGRLAQGYLLTIHYLWLQHPAFHCTLRQTSQLQGHLHAL
jgi:hypothetical protein